MKQHSSTLETSGIQGRARFDLIRYANCWEDTDVLLEGLDIRPGGNYLSIASAGDNSLGMLSGDPGMVLAADLSFPQLACVEVRKQAFAVLEHEEVLEFLGVRSSVRREELYARVASGLSPAARSFWDQRLNVVRAGIIHAGKFERYFQSFRKWVMPLVHGPRTVDGLFVPMSGPEREHFYRGRWDTWRWRALFKIFFSRRVMGAMGRDPEFFKYVEGSVAERILGRVEQALIAIPAAENPYLEYILRGEFRQSLPFYLRPENFQRIKRNLNKLVLFQGSIEDAMKAHRPVAFDGFNLSDIFEYMDGPLFRSQLAGIVERSADRARLVYWNMLADRNARLAGEDRLASLEELSRSLLARDKAFFYKAVVVEEVHR